jgi:hypothetical protein
VRQLKKPSIRRVREDSLSLGLRLRETEFAVASFKVANSSGRYTVQHTPHNWILGGLGERRIQRARSGRLRGCVEHQMKALTRISHSRQSCDSLCGGAPLPAAERSGQKFGTSLEVPIKTAFGYAEPRSERLHRERPEARLGNELKRSLGPIGRR